MMSKKSKDPAEIRMSISRDFLGEMIQLDEHTRQMDGKKATTYKVGALPVRSEVIIPISRVE